MAPKKKPGKKEDGLSDKELLQKAEAELLSLRRLLELKTFEVLLCTRLVQLLLCTAVFANLVFMSVPRPTNLQSCRKIQSCRNHNADMP